MSKTGNPDKIIDLEPLGSAPREKSLTRVEEKESGGAAKPAAVAAPAPEGGNWLVVAGLVLALLWMGGAAAYLVGFSGIDGVSSLTIVQMTGLGFVLAGPALFILIAAFAARAMIRFAAHAQAVQLASAQLLAPADAADGRMRTLSTAVSGEIGRINQAMEAALARLGAIEEVLRHHGESIKDAASDASTRSKTLIAELKTEREALGDMAGTLDKKAKEVAEAISEQSKMVARAAELAETAAEEGGETLAGAAEKLADAAETALARTGRTSNALDEERQRLAALSDSLTENRKGLESTWSEHREYLADAAEILRREQDKIASSLDFHRAELESLTKIARQGASELNEATESGGNAMRGAVETAIEQARRFSDTVRKHTREAVSENAKELEKLEQTASRAREASEESRQTLASQADNLRVQIEKLNESTFDAATRADAALNRQIEDAAKAVERVSALSDEANTALTKRFDDSLEAWQTRMNTLEQRFERMQQSMNGFPDTARERVTELEGTVRESIESLGKAARAAADDAKDIDFALQARMRQNYELLSDFVLRMGAVGGAGNRPAPDVRDDNLPDPLSRGGGQPAPKEDGWRWRDLVSDLREKESPSSPSPRPAPEQTQSVVDSEALGWDAVDAAAKARRAQGIGAMREAVREQAPRAVKALSERLMREPALEKQARALVSDFEPEVSRAVRDEEAETLGRLLREPRGCRYLLASAALGEAW